MSRHRLLLAIFATALLLVFVPGGDNSTASPAEGDGTATNFRTGLANVDFTGLDQAGRERALDLMNQHGCGCGCGMTIAQCRVQDQACGISPGRAKLVVDAVKVGKTNEEVATALSPAATAAAAAADMPSSEISLDGVEYKGAGNAPVVLVEWADYQCPYCARAMPVVKELLQKYPEDVKYVFKQMPLTSIHKNAEPAARASLAAARQGKFWEMHDLLFENYRALDTASLNRYASELGLDTARFERDMADPAIADEVRAEMAEGQAIGVRGTPTFFMNGVRVPSWDLNTMSKLVESVRSGEDIKVAAGQIQQELSQRRAEQRRQQAAARAQMANTVFDIEIGNAPIKGNADAPVTIVEFGDFQCPFCANSQTLIRQVLEAYPDQVRLVFKHLPLVSIHPNARPAAMASVEALDQGKFWEMREILYQNYNKLNRQMLNDIALQVGLDMQAFEAALASGEHGPTVDKDVSDAQRYMVTGTPTYFVNGKRVMQRDFNTFKKMIDEALASSGSPAAGL